ncbi:MAG: hypothetical protein WC678_01275 [Parcubacteria group bacterium]|jgi:hypothetical protein
METEQVLAKIGEMSKAGLIPFEALQALINEHDPIILVNRSIKPVYTDSVKIKYPEFELSGPTKFDVTKLHSIQIDHVSGDERYKDLIAKDLLKNCLNLSDILAIHSRGDSFFRKHLKCQCLTAWKSIALHRSGCLAVPHLLNLDGLKVSLNWIHLSHFFVLGSPIILHANPRDFVA